MGEKIRDREYLRCTTTRGLQMKAEAGAIAKRSTRKVVVHDQSDGTRSAGGEPSAFACFPRYGVAPAVAPFQLCGI
jgi:hypothetical protein